MLEELVVENLVLVRSARLTLHPGLNVLTGETGAGKTILAEAVGLLLGGRADAALVGPAGAEAYVEATFSDVELPEELAELAPEDAEGVVVARRVGREGRSRALLYGRSCTRDDLERIGQSLIEMVSQHEARRLVRPAVQLDLLDASAGEALTARRAEMATAWRTLGAARRALADAESGAAGEQARLAELRALAEAVAGVDPQPGEEDDLVRERNRLRHLDVLLEAARTAADLLNPDDGAGAVAQAGEAAHVLDRVRDHDPALAEPADELARIAEELRETATGLRSYLTGLDADPAVLDRIEERLEQLAELRRRFGATRQPTCCRVPRLPRASWPRASAPTSASPVRRQTSRRPKPPPGGSRQPCTRGVRRPPSRSPGPSSATSPTWAWTARVSRSRSPRRRSAHAGATPWRCAWPPTRGCRPGRSAAWPPAASSPASRSPCGSRRGMARRPRCSSSTRSTRASAAARRAC